MHYYLAQWRWNLLDPGWEPPVEAVPGSIVGSIDLRSLAHQGQAGGTPLGYGFFASTAPIVTFDGEYLGSDLQRVLTPVEKDAWRTLLGITEAVSASSLLNILWETLTVHGDAEAANHCKPLGVTRQGSLELVLGGHSVVRTERWRPGVTAGSDRILAVAQKDYAALRRWVTVEGQQLPPRQRPPADLHLRSLWVMQRKLGVPYRTIQADEPDEQPVRPGTSYTETFPGTSATLGGDHTWTEVVGGFSNESGRGHVDDGGFTIGDARLEADVSSSDHATTGTIEWEQSGTLAGGLATRFAPAAETFYAGWAAPNAAEYRNVRMVSGSRTQLGSATSTTVSPATPYSVPSDVNGSTVRVNFNAEGYNSVTDTNISSGTRGGIYAVWLGDAGNGQFWDNVTIDDGLGGGLDERRFPRGVERGAARGAT